MCCNKVHLKEISWERGHRLDSPGSGQGHVAVSCDHSNGGLDSIK